jgi:hypothetical protein
LAFTDHFPEVAAVLLTGTMSDMNKKSNGTKATAQRE